MHSLNYERVVSREKNIFTLAGGIGGEITDKKNLYLNSSIHGHLLIPITKNKRSLLDFNLGTTIPLFMFELKRQTPSKEFIEFEFIPTIGAGYRYYFKKYFAIRGNALIFISKDVGIIPFTGISFGKTY